MRNFICKFYIKKLKLWLVMLQVVVFCLISHNVMAIEEVNLYPGYTRVVVLGDQWLSNYGVGSGQSFDVVLQRRLIDATGNLKLQVISTKSFEDRTMLSAYRDLQKIISYQPNVVIIELGYNDMMQKKSLQEIYDYLENIVKDLSAKQIKIVIAGIKPPKEAKPEYFIKMPQIYKYIAYKYQTQFYPDLLEGVRDVPQYSNKNGTPNFMGVEFIAQNIVPLVIKLLPSN